MARWKELCNSAINGMLATFRNRFGGECLTYAPEKPKPRTSKNLPAKEPPPE
jgi:hypothetical protein